jgi:LPS-assembly lipoprotein
MSWRNPAGPARRLAGVARIAAWAALGAALAGCGFHPLYANRRDSGLDAELAAIKVAPASERIGQLLAISLRQGLNPSGDRVTPRYTLNLVIATGISDFAIRTDGTASRELYAATVSFNLQTIEGNRVVLAGSARANDSYDVGANPYTTIVAASDADRKAAASMSQQILAQIAVFLQHQAKS